LGRYQLYFPAKEEGVMKGKGLVFLALFLMVVCSSSVAFAETVWNPTPVWISESGGSGTYDYKSTLTKHADVGDVNNDGYPDVLIGDPAGQQLEIYYNNAGQLPALPDWTSADPWQHGYLDADLADMNGDGWLDIIALQHWGGNAGWHIDGAVVIYFNNGGSFNTVPDSTYWYGRFRWKLSLTPADIDQDGDVDVLIHRNNNTLLLMSNEGGVLSQNPVGGYIGGENVGFRAIVHTAVADFDDDGIMEVAVPGVSEGPYPQFDYYKTYVFKYNAASSNLELIYKTDKTGSGGCIDRFNFFNDYDNDGDLDLITSAGQIYVNSGGTLSSDPRYWYQWCAARAAAVGDYNLDGLTDVVKSFQGGRYPNKFRYFQNTEDGFELEQEFNTGLIFGLVNIDYDLDGDLDLLVSLYRNQPYILSNETITNLTPTANAGADVAAECAGPQGATVTLDGSGSTDPDGDALTYIWTGTFGTATGVNATVTLPLGTHTVTLTVDDGNGGTGTDDVVITVADTTPPVITIFGISDGETYALGLEPEANYDVMDTCSGVASSNALLMGGDGLGLGSFTYTVTAMDNAGNTGEETAAYEVIATADGLIALIRQMVDEGLIAPKMENSLVSQVQNGALGAFINHVEAQTGKKIDPAAAAILINAANYMLAN
jgi:hypothetical protein